MSVLPWLYPHSYQGVSVFERIIPIALFNIYSTGGSDCWCCCRTDCCRGSTDNNSLHCLHVNFHYLKT